MAEDDKKSIFLLCKNGTRYFGVPIEPIIEIVESKSWTPFPGRRKDLLGLMNLRGEVIPIVNFCETFGGLGIDARLSVIVCKWNGTTYGFPVEEVEQVVELDSSKFQQVDGVVSPEMAGLLTHLSLMNGRNILILDLNKGFAKGSAAAA